MSNPDHRGSGVPGRKEGMPVNVSSASTGMVHSLAGLMSPSAMQLFTAATGDTINPNGDSLDAVLNAQGKPVNGPGMQAINTFEMALTTASAGGGQITAASFQQIVQNYANQGQNLDSAYAQRALAALDANAHNTTGSAAGGSVNVAA